MAILKHIGRGPKSAISAALQAGSLVVGDLVVTTDGNELVLIERDGSLVTIESRTQADFELLGTKIPAGSDVEEVLAVIAAKFAEVNATIGEVPEGETVMSLIETLEANMYDDTEVRGLISKAQGDVDALAGKVGTVPTDKTVVGMIGEAQTAAETAANGYTDGKIATEVSERNAAITTAKTEVNGYTDTQVGLAKTYAEEKAAAAQTAAEATAKGYTDAQIAAEVEARNAAIATAVANSEHLKRSIVEALPAVEDGDVHTIYMVEIEDGEGNQKYEEFMLIDGAFEKIGDSAVDLTDYALKSEVQAAEAAAKSHAEAQASAAETAAKAHADEKAAAAQAAAEATAKGYTDTEVAGAKTYAEEKATAAETAAKSHAEEKAAAAETAAKAHADSVAGTAKTEAVAAAKEYTDAEVAGAKTYAEGQASAAEAAAKSHADTVAGTAKTEAVAAAKEYTDAQIAAEVEARNTAIALAKGEANTYADGKLVEAKTYTDEKIAAEVTARDEAIEDAVEAAIAAEVTARNQAIADAVAASEVTWVDFGA